MLSETEQANSLLSAQAVIEILSGDSGRMHYTTTLHVEASVRGRVVVDDAVPILFTVHHDMVRISLMWEDAGHRSYKALGLYGYSDTKWVHVTYNSDFMHVVSDAYVLRVSLVRP
jgi:hypothetical protein